MVKRTRLESMMKSIYENIYTSQQLDEISNMVFRSNLSEEVPIIDRYERINILQESIAREDFSVCLLNCSLFLLYNLKLYLRHTLSSTENDNLFLCITLLDPIDEINDVRFSVPNILISTKLGTSYLTQDKVISLKKEKYLSKMYGPLIDESMFACYKVITPDKYGNITRYYIVPKRW